MAVFFKEKLSVITVSSIILALAGIALLYKNESGSTLKITGIILVMVSSLSYAIYIIVVNKSSIVMSSVKLTFYVLLFCIGTIVIYSFTDESNHLQLLGTPSSWMWATMLALIPTIISLITMVKAVHAIGSTPTAILGALEPLTAVIIGISVFGELLTVRLFLGIVLILSAVLLIIIGKSFKSVVPILKDNKAGRILKKHFNRK